LFIVNKDDVIPLEMDPSRAMKMAVSGGMTGYEDVQEENRRVHH
jgi:uncharacterized membrane protein